MWNKCSGFIIQCLAAHTDFLNYEVANYSPAGSTLAITAYVVDEGNSQFQVEKQILSCSLLVARFCFDWTQKWNIHWFQSNRIKRKVHVLINCKTELVWEWVTWTQWKENSKESVEWSQERLNFYNFMSKSELSELFREAVLLKSTEEIILVPWLW